MTPDQKLRAYEDAVRFRTIGYVLSTIVYLITTIIIDSVVGWMMLTFVYLISWQGIIFLNPYPTN